MIKKQKTGSTKRLTAVSVCLGLTMAASASTFKLKLHKVVDPNTHLLAGSYFIPAGWTAKDEITWMPLNYGTPCVGKSTITSPDGKMSLLRVSAISVTYGQSTLARNGMPPPPSIGDFLAQLWAKEHPVPFQVVSKEESPVDKHLGQFLTYSYDGTVKLAFNQDGQRMIVKGYGRIDGYETRPMGAAMVAEGQWTISNIIGATAPEDKFTSAMKLYAICLSSYKLDPHFFSVILQVQKQAERNAYQQSENALALSRHIAANQQQISSGIMNAYETRSKALDKTNEKFDDYIRGLDTYTDSDGTKVKLPNWHAHLYSDGDGNYYYSDSPGGVSGNFHELHHE